MASDVLVSRLTTLLEPQTAEHGLELVAVEVGGPKTSPLVRVLLDREDGITIDAIAEASGWIMDALDSVPDLGDDYTLEASSPGSTGRCGRWSTSSALPERRLRSRRAR